MKRVLDALAWLILVVVYGGFALSLLVGFGFALRTDPTATLRLALALIGFVTLLGWAGNRATRRKP